MIQAKKSLGQNFLIDKNILEKIINTTDIHNKTILEIGPGTGNLTSYILKKNPKKLFVIEKDNMLAKDLANKFNKNFEKFLKKNQKILFDDIKNNEEKFKYHFYSFENPAEKQELEIKFEEEEIKENGGHHFL